MSSVNRWIPEEKCRKEIQCPRIIKEYNGGMGGVDLADMMIALYRIAVKTHRWYIKVFLHCVDICKVNAWLLYRRDCNLLEISKRKQQRLLQLSSQISEGLIKANKVAAKAGTPGRPRKRQSNNSVTTPHIREGESQCSQSQPQFLVLTNVAIGLFLRKEGGDVDIAKVATHIYFAANAKCAYA
eukprot:Seg1212.2 transcript_id=Seg1212.2/GoldUCD/mRNA.D3Y31 product="Chimeric ERCC6-PGBD3 protein" protein_id=Seg1212.2/GoldUCD/D3Y31